MSNTIYKKPRYEKFIYDKPIICKKPRYEQYNL